MKVVIFYFSVSYFLSYTRSVATLQQYNVGKAMSNKNLQIQEVTASACPVILSEVRELK
jgi:hypothetical protein